MEVARLCFLSKCSGFDSFKLFLLMMLKFIDGTALLTRISGQCRSLIMLIKPI